MSEGSKRQRVAEEAEDAHREDEMDADGQQQQQHSSSRRRTPHTA